MSYYAQTNYPEIQGINGKYTIHDIGCFLTSFCNLEQDYGQTIDPLTLNNYFRDNNIFIDVDDGVRDDVDWGFVQRWDVNTRVTQLGGPGWPNSNQSIVKFAYTSPRTGHPTTHFCKVFDYTNQQIVDSWDGVVKHISSTVYGQPVAWATYEHSVPQAVSTAPARTPKDYMQYSAVPNKTMRVNKLQTNWWNLNNDSDNIDNFAVAATLTVNTPFTIGGYAKNMHFPMYTYAMSPEDFNRANNGDYSTNNGINLNDLEDIPYTPPAAPEKIPLVEYYELVTSVMSFDSAQSAKAHAGLSKTLEPGRYVLLKTDGTTRQLAYKNTDTTTYWINDFDNRIDEPIIVAAPAVVQPTLPVDPPKVITELVNDTSVTAAKKEISWGWLNPDHSPTVYRYKGTAAVPIKDLEGTKPSLTMNAGLQGPISRYTQINGTEYLIPDSEFKKGNAYGIPAMLMAPVAQNSPQRLIHDVETDGEKWVQYLETGFQSARRLITDITPVAVDKAAYRTKQLIDGFRAGKRK